MKSVAKDVMLKRSQIWHNSTSFGTLFTCRISFLLTEASKCLFIDLVSAILKNYMYKDRFLNGSNVVCWSGSKCYTLASSPHVHCFRINVLFWLSGNRISKIITKTFVGFENPQNLLWDHKNFCDPTKDFVISQIFVMITKNCDPVNVWILLDDLYLFLITFWWF